MDAQAAVDYVNERFKYMTDSKQYSFKEVWRIMSGDKMVGDCEDYSLTVLWLMAGKSVPKMLMMLLTRKARIYHYTHRTTGTGHAGLWVRGQGYVDNISKKWNDGSFLDERGYKRFPIAWPVTLIILKFVFGGMGKHIASLFD